MKENKSQNGKKLLSLIVLVLLCTGYLLFGGKPGDSGERESAIAQTQAVTEQTETVTETETVLEETEMVTEQTEAAVVYYFRNNRLLTEHFDKHGSEFDYATKEEYEAGASRVVTNKEALHKKEAEDGDDVYYLEDTNEFVIVSTDGYIRTYFKPRDGIRYYNRQ